MTSLSAIAGLSPANLWQRFYEISQIPRPSKKEERITAHFEQLFTSMGIPFSKDTVGNLVARVPASKGYENAPIVILQGHSDMVCEKNRGTEHDFDRDPIYLVRDGGGADAVANKNGVKATASGSAQKAPRLALTTASAWRLHWPCSTTPLPCMVPSKF